MPARDIVDSVTGNEELPGQEPPSAWTVRHADRNDCSVLVAVARKEMVMQLRKERARQAQFPRSH
jgi:hypothetical protein